MYQGGIQALRERRHERVRKRNLVRCLYLGCRTAKGVIGMVPGYGLRPCECQQFCRLLRVALLRTNLLKFCQCHETSADLRLAEPRIGQKRFDLLGTWLLFVERNPG